MRTYEEKRHFDRTPEPTFGAEDETALLSYALPKAALPEEGEQFLLIETELHPLKYLHFVGEIMHGEYGAGKMKIFDQGTYTVVDANEKRMIIELRGKDVQGRYAIIHQHGDQYLITKVKE
jgi:bifunctional non-homologous end joining protein LigD